MDRAKRRCRGWFDPRASKLCFLLRDRSGALPRKRNEHRQTDVEFATTKETETQEKPRKMARDAGGNRNFQTRETPLLFLPPCNFTPVNSRKTFVVLVSLAHTVEIVSRLVPEKL